LFLKDEETYERIIFVFPINIITVNKSFFLGAFEEKIRNMGRRKFNLKFGFASSNHICKKIENIIEYSNYLPI